MTTQYSLPPPRSWDVDMLSVLGKREGIKAKHLKAVPVLILERWVQGERLENDANLVRTRDIAKRLESSGLVLPFKPKGDAVILGALSTIQRARNLTRPAFIEYRGKGMFWFNLPYYEPLLQEYRQEYLKLFPDDYRKLFPKGEPEWGATSVTNRTDDKPQSLKILQVLEDYENDWQRRLQEAQDQANKAEQEVRELSGKLQQIESAMIAIRDDILKKRIDDLGPKARSDTKIREAGVILEARLRDHGKDGSELDGVKLVDKLLTHGTGSLVFSTREAEQDGVRMLYRGAMQFIRNPPMHKLIEYREDSARLLIRIIDSLLELLSEAELKSKNEV